VLRQTGEVAVYCSNMACPERLVRAIEYFVSQGAMDIEGLGERLVRQLVTAGLIHDVADLYFLSADRLMGLEGFAQKKVDNLLAAIDASRTRSLSRVLTALGIKGVGETVAALLVALLIDRLDAGFRSASIEGSGRRFWRHRRVRAEARNWC
jgi:DNA ligase (NAD+)